MQSIAETCVRFDAAHLSINLVSEIAVPMFPTLSRGSSGIEKVVRPTIVVHHGRCCHVWRHSAFPQRCEVLICPREGWKLFACIFSNEEALL